MSFEQTFSAIGVALDYILRAFIMSPWWAKLFLVAVILIVVIRILIILPLTEGFDNHSYADPYYDDLYGAASDNRPPKTRGK
jgi:membrane protein YdbS with pleckstrin-like domain